MGQHTFRDLRPENGGFLRVASTFDEHLAQLSGVLGDPESARAELTRFVSHFIRPHGIDRPATPILADAVERYGATPSPAPVRVGRLRTALVAWPLKRLSPLAPSASARRRAQNERKRRAVQENAAVAGGKS